jgi:hypothetical protein
MQVHDVAHSRNKFIVTVKFKHHIENKRLSFLTCNYGVYLDYASSTWILKIS